MEHLYIKTPKSVKDWEDIATEFEKQWQQHSNCIGAIDGKHIVIQQSPGTDATFYNYKHTHSVVLLAVVGPNYECIYADVGKNGRVSDGGVWKK